MAQAEPSKQANHPRRREEAESEADTIAALTISAAYSQAEVQALRDAVADALRAIHGKPSS